jgi:hypothetical protein
MEHPNPSVFVSCASHELGETRKRLSEILEKNGFTPVYQDIFGTTSGDLRQMLRDKIDACHGLIHIVGHAYGPEPPTHEPEFGRVSYTQFEFHYARKRKKRTWLLFADHGCSRDRSLDSLDLPHDPSHPDPSGYQAECHNLQLAYRSKMQKDGHVFHTAVNDAALEELIDRLNVAMLWQSVCWNELEAACDAKEQSMAAISGYAEDRYYQKRAIEETFSDFLQTRSERGMIIVGESGMGKTTLLVHLASVCSKEKHPYRMFNGGEFIPGRALEAQLVDGLGFKNLREQKVSVELFWSTIDAEGERLGKHLLIFIDAINEYNPEGSMEAGPVGLMRELDQMISRLNAKFSRVKFVVTTRPETWRATLRFAPTCFQDEKLYFTSTIPAQERFNKPVFHAIRSLETAGQTCSTTLTSQTVPRLDLSFERNMSFGSGGCERIGAGLKRGSGSPTIVSPNTCWPSDFGFLFKTKQNQGYPCRRQQNPFSRQISRGWCFLGPRVPPFEVLSP